MEKANRKQTIFSSKPLGVTAWIFLGNKLLSRLKIVSMYWRMGLPKNSSHAGIGRLEQVLIVIVGVALVGENDRAFGQLQFQVLEHRNVSFRARLQGELNRLLPAALTTRCTPASRRSSAACSGGSLGTLRRFLREGRADSGGCGCSRTRPLARSPPRSFDEGCFACRSFGQQIKERFPEVGLYGVQPTVEAALGDRLGYVAVLVEK